MRISTTLSTLVTVKRDSIASACQCTTRWQASLSGSVNRHGDKCDTAIVDCVCVCVCVLSGQSDYSESEFLRVRLSLACNRIFLCRLIVEQITITKVSHGPTAGSPGHAASARHHRGGHKAAGGARPLKLTNQ